MNIDQTTLALRIKEARVSSNLTQEQVANALGLPRTAVVQIESANRAVSTLELAELAKLFSRSIMSFFVEEQSRPDDVLVALFRAAHVEGQEAAWQSEVSRYISIYRTGVELESLLKRPANAGPPTYDMPDPDRVMEAVDQGTLVADQERRRLGLGYNPIPDMSDLINGQHVWASGADLPDNMSGLFLSHDSVGLCILVNFSHPRARKRFSYAHEYAHALLDRKHAATVSLESNRAHLCEVRANAFAASFLIPKMGVSAFLSNRFKGGPSVVEQTVYDPATEERNATEVKGQRRAPPRSQDLTYEDAAALAHHFGVSYQAALFRLKSLLFIDSNSFDALRKKEQYGKSYLNMLQLLDDLDGTDQHSPDKELVSQVVHLALEAYRRDELSKGKLRDLSTLLGVSPGDLLELAEAA